MGPYFAQITMHATVVPRGGETKKIANVYNFKRPVGTVLPRVKANVESAFQASIGVAVLAALSIDYTQTVNSVRWLDDATDMAMDFTEANVGGRAGERYDNFTAAYVLLKTDSRKTKGSKHYSPLGESDVNGDAIVSPLTTNLDAIAAAILAGFTDSDGNVWQSTVVNSKNAIFGVNPTLFGDAIVVQALGRRSVGTMKRRKIKGVY